MLTLDYKDYYNYPKKIEKALETYERQFVAFTSALAISGFVMIVTSSIMLQNKAEISQDVLPAGIILLLLAGVFVNSLCRKKEASNSMTQSILGAIFAVGFIIDIPALPAVVSLYVIAQGIVSIISYQNDKEPIQTRNYCQCSNIYVYAFGIIAPLTTLMVMYLSSIASDYFIDLLEEYCDISVAPAIIALGSVVALTLNNIIFSIMFSFIDEVPQQEQDDKQTVASVK